MMRSMRATVAAAALSLAIPAAAGAAGTTAPAKVFFPNPVQSLQDESLTDQRDTDFFSADPFLRTAYKQVTLTDLDGSGTLTGTYARVESETGNPALAGADGFQYTRDDD